MNATPQLNESAEGGSSPRSCSRSSMVNFIRRYNRWRRGDESLTMESPKAIGDALDAVCDTLDEHANEIKGWQNKWECAVETAARAQLDAEFFRGVLEQVLVSPALVKDQMIRRALDSHNDRTLATQPAPQMPEKHK